MHKTPSIADSVAATETPAAFPDGSPEASAETPAVQAKVAPRARTRIGDLRAEIADLRNQNIRLQGDVGLARKRYAEAREQKYEIEDQLVEASVAKGQQAATIGNLRAALEFVISFMASDTSPADFIRLAEEKAVEYGIALGPFSRELQDALGKAYAAAPARAAKVSDEKKHKELAGSLASIFGGPRTPRTPVPGRGIDPMAELLAGILGSDPSGSMDDFDDLQGASGRESFGDPRDTETTYFHPMPDCPGHPRTR